MTALLPDSKDVPTDVTLLPKGMLAHYLSPKAKPGDRAVAKAELERRKQEEAERERQRQAAAPAVAEPPSRVEFIRSVRVDLSSEETWNANIDDDDFLVEPWIARGRGHALFASAKDGKSYVVLQGVAAACVPGHTSWAEPVKELLTVVYLDYEMTKNDLIERLTAFGYSSGEDYSRLHYIRASALGADLDTLEGGQALVNYCREVGADLCVIDTMSRAVSGEENSTDTIRKFDLHTGRFLKFYEIAFIRLDHAGKDKSRGQRGASGKNDDVDIVWELSRTDTGVKLKRTHSRVSWGPTEVHLRFEEDDEGNARHVRVDQGGFAAGTREKADEWLELGIPLDASRRRAKEMGFRCSTNLFGSVKKYLNQHAAEGLL